MPRTRKIFLVSFSLLLWGIVYGIAQEPDIKKDTAIQINPPDKYGYLNLRTQRFFDTSTAALYKNRWLLELQNVVIRPPIGEITDTLPTVRGDLEFMQYEGMTVRNIRFVKVDVFGATIMDTALQAGSWLERRANAVHIKTNNPTLDRLMLVKVGDAIDPRILADNIRLFRDQSYIEDARIIVEPVLLMPGFADLKIIIKDQWSKAFFLELSDIDAGKLEIWDRNIFGTGNEVQNNFHWNPDKSATWGYEAIYNNRNIMGSFVDGRFHYSNVFDNEGYGLQFNRKFYTPNTKFAGGASAFHQGSIRQIWNSDTGYFLHPVSGNTTDLWLGRALKLNRFADLDKNRLNLILATRFYKQNYFDRPEVGSKIYYQFHDKSVWLNTIALSSQSFYQSNLIYSYGRTEDIPIGSLLNLTFGPEFGEFEQRMYASLSFARGNYIDNLGYVYFRIEEGGFITKSGSFEQAMFNLNMNFFSNLFIYNRFKFRQLISINYTRGIKRFEDDRISINDNFGLRGFNEENVVGQQRFVMNMEISAFSPWYIAGFRFTFFGYTDFALLGPESSNFIYEDVYTGMGFGTRIRNERLVFPTFSFRFGFYPNLKDVPFSERIHFSGEPRLKPNNFYLTNPSMLEFQ